MIRAIASRAIRFALDGLQGPTNEQARENLEQRLSEAEARLTTAEAKRVACLDALSEHVSPDATADTPRMIRPSSVLAGIRSLQGRLRDARSDLREHDAALEAAVERRSEEADASTEQARAILNAVPGEDIVSAARRTMASLARSVEKGEALRYDLSTIVDEAFGMQPVMTHEELLSFLESGLRERARDLAAARAEKAEAEENRDKATERLDKVLGEVRGLKVQLAAARARIAELEAPMPEATVEELGRAYRDGCGGFSGQATVFMNGGIRAVAERVRRERCLIARAVAGKADVDLVESGGAKGAWYVRVATPTSDKGREVPAAEVPAELARMLTEVGA